MNWLIISWVACGLLMAVNVFIFIKLKKASEQMMKMAFPKAKNMTDAMSQMQGMMGGMGLGGVGGAGVPDLSKMMSQMGSKDMQAQMKAAMEMLSQMKGQGPGPGQRRK
jgi:hypothetical protein